MLVQLGIKDFALIDQLIIEFDERLNVLTGETGAGKSIIIDAVSMLLGARANSTMIRYGCNKAYVEGVIYVPEHSFVEHHLEQFGIQLEEDRMMILTREIGTNGKNICRINNRIVTVANFREISAGLINIYGQHDYQALSNSKMHLQLLDSLGGEDLKAALLEIQREYSALRELEKRYAQLQEQISHKNERMEFLQFKANELEQAALVEGEDEEIQQQLLVLDNQEKIVKQARQGYNLLYGNGSVYDMLTQVLQGINSIREYESGLEETAQGIEGLIYQVEDYARSLNTYSEQVSFDESYKEQLAERKYFLERLKKKYRGTIGEILEEQVKITEELQQLGNSEFESSQLEEKVRKQRDVYLAVCRVVSTQRKAIAKDFEQKVVEQLVALAMGNTVFEVAFKETEGDRFGTDQVEFLVSPNPGQPVLPLDKIASGGEMSRIMLAFKVILAGVDQLGTLIFDEIDSGIGGNIVVKVAEKLQQVSDNSQVICVTHAPHIASFANNHYRIQKYVENGQTKTTVALLGEEDRLRELARMLGDEGKASYDHAVELRKLAQLKVAKSV